jgi:hypothetical protein
MVQINFDDFNELADNLDIIFDDYIEKNISLSELSFLYMEYQEKLYNIDREDILTYMDIEQKFTDGLKKNIFNKYMVDKLN